MNLKAYFDESATGDFGFVVVSGYIAMKDDWCKFYEEWANILKSQKVPNFHFKDFNAKVNYSNPNSPYYNWSDEKREEFFYDLAMALSHRLVPVGSDYPIKEHQNKCLETDPIKEVFKAFFSDIKEAVSAHWPDCAGKDINDKIRFFYDDNKDPKWATPLRDAHISESIIDARFGGLSFENDEDPEHLGLQAADFFSAIYRQTAENRRKHKRALQEFRVIDLILFHNLREKGHPLFYEMDDLTFSLMINLCRADEKRQKKEWAAKGITGEIYYPTKHFPFEQYGIKFTR